MPFDFRKTFRLGKLLRLNLSKRGVSLSERLGRVSTNTRTRRLRVSGPFGLWWQSRKAGQS
jgi:Protein of unknown function (DUF4236)